MFIAMNRTTIFLHLLFLFCHTTVFADYNWPGFRGGGDSHTSARKLPLEWSDTKNLAWNAVLPGYGQSSPIIWRDHVYLTAIDGPNKEKLLFFCLDLKTGRQLWLKEFANTFKPVKITEVMSQAAPTPVADDKGVYVFFELGDLFGFGHNGKLRWRRQLAKEYGAFRSSHGLSSSLVATKEELIVLIAHQGAGYLLAVNKRDGQNEWKTERKAGGCWTTPLVIAYQGREQILVSGSGSVMAYEAETGRGLWTVNGLVENDFSSPSVAGDLVVIGAGVKGSNLAIRLGGAGDVTQSHIAWRAEEAASNYNSPLVYRGLVYFVNKVGVAFCLELATGKELWRKRLAISECWASSLAVGDRIYIFGNEGRTMVLRAGRQYEQLALNTLDIERIYGIAAVEGTLLLRSGKKLICLRER
jgi:outer membrane protein assembly factor BamB